MTTSEANRRPRRNPSIDPDEDVELGALVKAHERGGLANATITVRVPRDLLARMSDYSRPRGMTVAGDLMVGAEQLIGMPGDPPIEHE